MNFSKFKITFDVDKESFVKINYRPFIAGMIAVIIMKMVMILGVELPDFFIPVTDKVEKFDSIEPELEQKIDGLNFTKDQGGKI